MGMASGFFFKSMSLRLQNCMITLRTSALAMNGLLFFIIVLIKVVSVGGVLAATRIGATDMGDRVFLFKFVNGFVQVRVATMD